MVKRKSRITERNTEPQKDNTLIATTPPPDSRVPGVIANHNAMVQWNLEHPNDKVYRIEDLIQKEKEANPSWVKRAANLAVNPVPTSNSGMMAVPNPDSPVRSTVKDELGVAMAAASTPMIGAELGIYGPVYGGLRLAAGSAAAAGASHVAGKAGDWIDEKAGTNWVGDLNRVVAPFAAFPLGAKYAYRGAVPLVGLASRYGTVPDWIAPPKVKTDAIKWGLKQRYKADIATPKIETEPTLQIGPEARPQLTGHFGKVKYYGPTMGKTTAARSNRGFIDFDDIIRNPSRAILDRFGFKTKADLYNSGNQEAIKAYEDMLLHEMQAFRANPENQGKRLLVSPSAVANPEVTGFDFDNVPVIPSRDVFIERNVARGGTPEESAEWYDALLARNPNLQIDDRFVSDIEKPFYVTPQASLRNITLDELRGIPKGERNARKPQPRVVNRDGSINWVNLQKAYDNLINWRGKWLKHDLFEEGLNNAPGEASTLWGHTTDVVRTAQQIPVPKGSSRAELVRAALIHDLGKLETGQERTEHPNHPYVSEEMIDDFGFPEFDTPTIRSAVRSHMNDTGMDQFMKSGIERKEILPGMYEVINFDLLKALQAADVSRGLSYDAAAARYPQLFRYQKQTPFKVNWFSGTPEEEITRVVNPILKREGYPVISLKDPIIPQLTDRRKRHRSFFRAIDIDGEPVDYQGVFNRQELERQALKNFGSDSDMFKRIAAATMTSREPTGGLKAFAIDVDHDGYWDGYGRRAEHGPTWFSKRIKFSPYKTDALFLSTSPTIVRQYSGKEPGSAIVGYLPMYPMQEGESPVQFMERTEFPMMDSDAILRDNTPMSLWQKYGWPYRMQTGRSLLSDLRDAYTGRLRELNKIGEWYDDPTIVENINKMVQELSDLGFNFKPPMDEKKGVFLVTSKRPYYNLFSENNLDRKTNILLHLGLITPKQARWRSFIPRRPNSWLFGLDPNDEMETFKKYVWNKNTIRKIVNKLFEKTPRHMVVSKEYKDYLKDEEAIIKFLRDRGIRPLWELPHFYQPIVFKGHGSFGSKPVTRGKEFTEGDGQGFVLAPKDSKVLEYREDVDPSLLPYSYYGRWTDENLYPVSRKTFKKGGIIKRQSGGPTPIVNWIKMLFNRGKNNYLKDYANHGEMYGYPNSASDLSKYITSPYKNHPTWGVPRSDSDNYRRSLFAKYFNLNSDELNFNPNDYLEESKYRPTQSSDPNSKYYTFKGYKNAHELFNNFMGNAGTFKIDLGEDENGKYISLYDNWDLAPFNVGKNWAKNKNSLEFLGGKPVEIYDRIYEKDDPEAYNAYSTKYRDENGLSQIPYEKKGGIIKADMGTVTRRRTTYNPSKDNTAKLNDDPYVSEYFEYDVLPRYQRENPNATKEQLDAVRNGYGNFESSVNPSVSDNGKVLGVAHTNGTGYFYGIKIKDPEPATIEYASEKPSRSTVVHENTHGYRQGELGNIPGEGRNVDVKRSSNYILGSGYKTGSGYTNTERDYLRDAYNLETYVDHHGSSYEGNDFKQTVESGATNAELRYKIWRELYSKLGRRPTLEEMDAYIEQYDESRLRGQVRSVNGYGTHSVQEQPGMAPVKEALIHVADNDQETDMTNLAKKGIKLSRFKSKLHK